MTIAIGILAIAAIGLGIYCYKLKQQQQDIIEINQARQRENEELTIQVTQKRTELSNLSVTIDSQNKVIQSLSATENNLRERAEASALEAYNNAKEKFDKELLEYQIKSKENYNEQLINISNQIEQESLKLKAIQDKQLAYIQAQQRQKEIEEQQDYYRLVISELELNDIKLLRDLQSHFFKKEAIDKLIWETYYKPAYDILMSHLFNNNNKTCGIYKITNLKNGEAYIGQSVDIKERFRQHIKNSLSYGPQTNKVYQQMQKYGQQNFTFEVIEEVDRSNLNERETYWIDFYKTKEFGMNKTVGGS